jgi:hypothetical protein
MTSKDADSPLTVSVKASEKGLVNPPLSALHLYTPASFVAAVLVKVLPATPVVVTVLSL